MDIMDQLGLAEGGTYASGRRGGAGYEAPPMAALNVQPAGVSGAATEAIQSKPLEAARVLARLPGGSAPTGRGRGANVASALGGHTMMKTPPSNKAAAVLDGLMGGFADSERSRSAATKAADDQLKQRFSMLKDLFGMDRAIAGDKRQAANDTFNQNAKTTELGLSKTRADAYAESVKSNGKGTSRRSGTGTGLDIEEKVNKLLEKHDAYKKLDADDQETIPRRKLSPEARQALKAEVAAERQRLLKLGGREEEATEPQTAAQPAVDPDRMAQPGLTPGSVSGTPEPGLSPEEMATGAESNPALVSPPVRQDRTALILQSARDHIAKGADRALVEAKMRDEYGVDPALLDME
jgi:hypothetical protein